VIKVSNPNNWIVRVGYLAPATSSGGVPDNAWTDQETGQPMIDAETGQYIVLNP